MSYYTDGNILSVLAFLFWIPIALYGMRRWPPAKATIVVSLGGLLFLPEVVFFKLPLLPEFAKLELISIWIFVGALLFHRERLKTAPKTWQFRALVGLLLTGAVITVFLNLDGFRVGSRDVPGHLPDDIIDTVTVALLKVVLPFILGAAMFRTSSDLRVLLTTFVLASLGYSLFQISELILSPQWHNWVYGFHQHSFLQALRGSGYRPMVFMAHGLALGLFTALAVLAGFALSKAKVRILPVPTIALTGYLSVILIVSKSIAALVYALVGAPLVWFASPRNQALAAAALVGFLMLYPVVRAFELIPIDTIYEVAKEQSGEERAHSLMFRFKHEKKTLSRALERRWFGWGGYCRACLFEPWTGEIESIRDGEWIIELGDRGIVGFVSKFGVLLFPLILLVRRIRRVPRESDRRLLAGLALMIGFAAFDLIPNSDFTRLSFFLAGALLGCMTGIQQQAAAMTRKRRAERASTAKGVAMAAMSSVAVALSLVAAPAAAAAPDAIGGGFTDSGIEGAYYANPDLRGTPAFTRRDVRIDFDWGEVRPVGGSKAREYASFPTDGFSVRWTGKLIPRFGEPYTLRGVANEGIRIKVRPPGQADWNTVVDRWDEPGPFESEPIAMQAGRLYEIEVAYRERSGEARCTLMWQSPSTPPEVIDPVRQQGFNMSGYAFADYMWADLLKSARYGSGAERIDAQGWPTTPSFGVIASEIAYSEDPTLAGTYLLRFEGEASIELDCCVNATFRAGGRAFDDKLPKGVGYDRATNATTATVTIDGSRAFYAFDSAQRDSERARPGVTSIQLMRPLQPGSKEHHRPDEIVYRPFKKVASTYFTTLRFLPAATSPGGDWARRTLPAHPFFEGNTQQENWEYLVMLANETGRDLYLSIPIGADDEYVEKLALLLRYGSDGKEPYRRATPNPVYPPLNPNLRVYIEWDNEIWNWAFGSTQTAQALTKAEHDRRSPTWDVINFDGHAGNSEHLPAVRRWHAIRTVQASKTFRRVWGDRAMGSRVRVLIEYQYDNYQDSALLSFDFIDSYYNNRASKHVSDPHPVSYYIWGGGGAAYYGLRNGRGEQSRIVFQDQSFEDVQIAATSVRARPTGSAWTFKGRAGLIRPGGKKTVDGFRNLPEPVSGKQAAFLKGTGSISQEIRFDQPGVYAVSFEAAGSDEEFPGYQPFDILVDGEKVSPKDQKDYRVSPSTALLGGWSRSINSFEEQWGSAPFEITEAGMHTVTFIGRSEAPNYLLIDNLRIASATALTTSGFHKGEALGEEGQPDLVQRLQSQAKYARAFGLQVVAYEAGWSVGGDFEQMPLQNWCKLRDPRAKGVNDDAIRIWDQSGSFLPVWGVYTYWPEHDFAGAGAYPIMQSFHEAARRLRSEPIAGRKLPATLEIDDADWSTYGPMPERSWWCRFVRCSGDANQWHAWMLIAPDAGVYTFQLRGEGEGRIILEVDGEPITELTDVADAHQPLPVMLTKGAHALRLVVVGSGIGIERIEIAKEMAGR